ncbi:MAG: Cna B-type domain-containing protein, partial [Bacilli bacterium]|nr:Cna B-type domain-containing protein [Bacilli bacterium]
IGGTYYAGWENGGHLTLSGIISILREFLTQYPSEAIIVSYQPESQYSSDYATVYNSAYRLFRSFAREINPSTGKSFVYSENNYFDGTYSRFPLLKECRGQILIKCSTTSGLCPGGFTEEFFNNSAITKYSPAGSYKDSEDERINHIKDFYNTYNHSVYSRVDQTDNDYITVGTNATDPAFITGIPDDPLEAAATINSYFFDEPNNNNSHFLKGDRRLGWVTMDGTTAPMIRAIYMSNLPDAVKVNIVPVNLSSGLDSSVYPDQHYVLQVGTKIKMPHNLYDYNQRNNNNYLVGYRFNNDTFYYVDDTATIEGESNIVCEWTSTPQSYVQIIWQDCENTHRYREESIKVRLYPSGNEITITEEEGWYYAIHNEDFTNVTPLWDRIEITEEHPFGEDTDYKYRFQVEEQPHGGFVLRLIHTPISVGTDNTIVIVWNDAYDQLGLRPDSLHVTLFEEGVEIGDEVLDNEGSWQVTFNNALFGRDGVILRHTCLVDPIDNYEPYYDHLFINMNVSLGLLKHRGSLTFVDEDESLRPDYATVGFYHGEDFKDDTQIFNYVGNRLDWDYPIDAIYLPEEYTTRISPIEGYTIIHTSPSFHHYAVQTSLIDVEMVTTKINEIGEVAFAAESKEKIDYARGLYDALSEEDQALVTNHNVLVAAEDTYSGMLDKYELAKPMILQIRQMAKLGTYSWAFDVEKAKKAYDKLDDEIKPYVTNYTKLRDEWELYEAMLDANHFAALFIGGEDEDDYTVEERYYTCSYTMERWDKHIERYEALSDLAKTFMEDDFPYPNYKFVVDPMIERYDLIITLYGTERYPDFLNRFTGPVVGVNNVSALAFNDSSSLAVVIVITSVLAVGVFLVIRKKRAR